MNSDDIRARFNEPSPSAETNRLRSSVRSAVMSVAFDLDDCLPEGRERSLALTYLQQALMWADAALIRADPVEVDS